MDPNDEIESIINKKWDRLVDITTLTEDEQKLLIKQLDSILSSLAIRGRDRNIMRISSNFLRILEAYK
jgi:hypothetical protein